VPNPGPDPIQVLGEGGSEADATEAAVDAAEVEQEDEEAEAEAIADDVAEELGAGQVCLCPTRLSPPGFFLGAVTEDAGATVKWRATLLEKGESGCIFLPPEGTGGE
jgi:hypothetical protein